MSVASVMKRKGDHCVASNEGDEVRLRVTAGGIIMDAYIDGKISESYRPTSLGDVIECLPLLIQLSGMTSTVIPPLPSA